MKPLDIIEDRIKTFIEQQGKFKNNPLKTELPNPETHNLSGLAKSNPGDAVSLIRNVDLNTLKMMHDYLPEMDALQAQIKKTLSSGKKIVICGCGASGRLAVLIEFMWKNYASGSAKNQVVGFLAGGDNAMIKSLEGFEDHKDFGIKQLYLSGFQDGDLLLAATASGESPFVIGAAEEAAKTSVNPWFIHCNTNDALKGRIQNHIIFNPKVKILSLYTGPMALTGSTRMQATTALMLGIWLPLTCKPVVPKLEQIQKDFSNIDFSEAEKFIVRETEIYKKKEFIFFETEPRYGLTVLTDTTERSPTFNLTPFENQLDKTKIPSWCYILFRASQDTKSAWEALLGRTPRTLDWDDDTSLERLYGFNFSSQLVRIRPEYTGSSHFYSIKKEGDSIRLTLDELDVKFHTGSDLFTENLLLKLIMNTFSTIVMGRLGFYEGNLMTSLYPSNSKLIDRAIRYIDFLLTVKYNKKIPYNDIAEKMFVQLKQLKSGESIVLKTVDNILKNP